MGASSVRKGGVAGTTWMAGTSPVMTVGAADVTSPV